MRGNCRWCHGEGMVITNPWEGEWADCDLCDGDGRDHEKAAS